MVCLRGLSVWFACVVCLGLPAWFDWVCLRGLTGFDCVVYLGLPAWFAWVCLRGLPGFAWVCLRGFFFLLFLFSFLLFVSPPVCLGLPGFVWVYLCGLTGFA